MPDWNAFAKTEIAARIRSSADLGTLPHALILSGAGDRAMPARYAAAAMECSAAAGRPCLSCASCRKVAADIHPDVVFVRDPEHKELSVDTIRAVRSDAFIRPNEGTRKVYIFEDCDALNEKGQNILLKIVEEGPLYAAFLFCTENSAALLQTIRSRCIEMKLGGAEENMSATEKTQRLAQELCRLSVEGNASSRCAFLFRMENEKPKREELGALFGEARRLAADALLASYGFRESTVVSPMDRWTKQQIAALVELLEQYRMFCESNVGVGLTLGGFAVEWERLARRDFPENARVPADRREGMPVWK